jgi:predicted ATP-grasp superfamily ATP-dependent carboligase
VTEAEKRNSLAALRSLGRRGVEVHSAGFSWLSQGFYSRYSFGRRSYPDPSLDPNAFVEALIAAVRGGKYDVLLPLHDYTTVLISKHRSEFESFAAVPVASQKVLETARDKAHLAAIAKEIGLDVPVTFCIRSRQELRRAAEKIDYPCVLKPRRGMGARGLSYVGSPGEIISGYEFVTSAAQKAFQGDCVFDFSSPVLQEHIPGETHDVCVLCNRGELRAALTQRRIKTYPATGGRGIVLETTNEPALVERVLPLLRRLNWHGAGQLEFRLDSRDGKAKLIEMNTRFWGALDLSIQAGMDFAYLTCQMADHGDIEPTYDYEVGVRYRMWFPYELGWALQTRTLASVASFFRLDRHSRYAIWPSDPMPHLIEFLYLMATLRRRSR